MFHPITRRFTQTTLLALSLLLLAALTACGGGGGGGSTSDTGTVTALTLPDRIQLTNVDESAGASRAASSLRGIFSRAAARGAYNDAGTDYANAEKQSWVEDTDALEMINTVLGVSSETGYANFVNQGPYLALVREAEKSKESQSGNSSTSTTTEELMEIVVDVTRASNNDPMIVKIWLYVNGPNDMPMLVRGYFEVSQGVSAEYPFGVLEAHFRGNLVGNDGSIGLQVMEMAISVNAEDGQVVLENVDDEGAEGFWESHRKVRVVADADMSQGNAYVSERRTEWNEDLQQEVTPDVPTILQIAFNETHFKETVVGGESTVYAKDSFTKRIFRYQVFDATTGAIVTRSSGFPIQTADGKHGYVGYYGLWVNSNVTVSDGDTVTDMDGNAYTVFKKSGKLTKHTSSSMPLSEINGVELSKWTDGQDVVVAWDSDSDTFIKLGERNQNNGQIVYYEAGDEDYHDAVTFQQWEGAWCESLKAFLRLGSLYFDTNGSPTTPTDGSTLYYHTEQTLSPSDATDLTLYTWSFTLALPITQSVIDGANAAQSAYWSSQAEKTLHFVAADMMLYADDGAGNPDTTKPVTMPADLNLDGTQYQGGYHIGPLTEGNYYNDHSPYHWEAHNASVYYTWNTGTEQWNQLTTVVDGQGNFAEFDPPLSFTYTHSTANDPNYAGTGTESPYNGKTFRLEYDGFSLQMPWFYDDVSGQWAPQINLADGTQLSDGSGTYVVKGVEQALILSPTSDPGDLTYTDVGAPSLAYDADKAGLVGDVPTENIELKVIKGEVIE